MAKVPNGVERLPKILIAWVGRTNVTDRRQTDGRAIAYSERKRASLSYYRINRLVFMGRYTSPIFSEVGDIANHRRFPIF